MPEAPEAPQVDLTPIQEQIASVVEQIAEITGKIDELGTAVTSIKEATPVGEGTKWIPKSWDEIPALIEERATTKATEIFNAKVEEANNARNEAIKAEQVQKQQIDQEFEKTLVVLEKQGKIPAVKDPNNENDEGRTARRELFGLGIKYDSPNLIAMADLREQIHNQGLAYDPNANNFVKITSSAPGKTAPVGSVRTTAPSGGIDQKTLRRLTLDQLVEKYGQS